MRRKRKETVRRRKSQQRQLGVELRQRRKPQQSGKMPRPRNKRLMTKEFVARVPRERVQAAPKHLRARQRSLRPKARGKITRNRIPVPKHAS